MTTLTHLDWQSPVILLKVVQRPFGVFGQISLQRAIWRITVGACSMRIGRSEAVERVEPLVF